MIRRVDARPIRELMANILVIDDDPIQCRLSEEMLKTHGFEPFIAASGAEGLALLESENIQAVILDLVMPEMDGMTVLSEMRTRNFTQPVIVQTAQPAIENIISAIRLGASDFFSKPIAPERMIISLQNALKRFELENCLRTETHRQKGALSFKDMAAKSPAMKKSIAHGEKAAVTQIPVLIEGEAGTGRDMMARAIHHHAKRGGKPFIALNCSTLDEHELDKMLFGGEGQKKTAFEQAQGGTLYLDEIGALSMELQGKLLALFTGKQLSTSADDHAPLDVRLICATSKRLLNLTKQKQFREDLYYRLNIFPVYMPPLRDRAEDIPDLISHFVTKFSVAEGRRIDGCTPEALIMLTQYEWPGNVRQLENAVYRAILLSEDGHLTPNEFPQIQTSLQGAEKLRSALKSMSPQAAPAHIDAATPQVMPLKPKAQPTKDRFLSDDGRVNNLAQVEKDLIEFALKKHSGKMSAVARALGIGRSTLYRKLKEYGLETDQSNAA
ncbi:transcriptional regulatory protein GlrR [Maritalea myrionectae]|uniref:DNA-binding transcriptional regulator NtrC n=2 Tax=Maritalea myrionectae TaxID=454601 RepID=A0A2R4MB72_9HYPH|nr:transcriptional regulatory protein GlrR [Maritalea myrionectae]